MSKYYSFVRSNAPLILNELSQNNKVARCSGIFGKSSSLGFFHHDRIMRVVISADPQRDGSIFHARWRVLCSWATPVSAHSQLPNHLAPSSGRATKGGTTRCVGVRIGLAPGRSEHRSTFSSRSLSGSTCTRALIKDIARKMSLPRLMATAARTRERCIVWLLLRVRFAQLFLCFGTSNTGKTLLLCALC